MYMFSKKSEVVCSDDSKRNLSALPLYHVATVLEKGDETLAVELLKP
jgi:hypothetical protein